MAENELITVPASEFAVLNPTPERKEVIDAYNETGEEFGPNDLTRVKTPTGGSTQWEIPGAVGKEYTAELAGAFVLWQKCGVLWPSFKPSPGTLPVLLTWDLITAEQLGPIPDFMTEELARCRLANGNYDWQKLSYNEWKSGENGIGKRCKEQRRIFILREKDVTPLFVNVQPGSLKSAIAWYNGLRNLPIPYWQLKIEMTLIEATAQNGEPYSKIVLENVAELSREAAIAIKKLWGDRLRRIATQIDFEPETTDD